MSAGIATMPDGMSASTYEAAQIAAGERAQQRQRWVELGYQVLGFESTPQKENGLIIGYTWQQRQRENTDGLPVGVVAEAKAAVEREAQARQALMAKFSEAREYISKHSLSAEAARVKVELMCAESATAHRAASEVTQRAVHALGKVAEQVQQARATLASVEPRRARLDAEYKAQLRQVDQDAEQARGVLLRLGVS